MLISNEVSKAAMYRIYYLYEEYKHKYTPLSPRVNRLAEYIAFILRV